MNVVLLVFRPTPVELSAALPLKLAGTVAVRKTLLFAGVVTEAVTGTVESPKIRPQVGKLAKATVDQTVRGIVGGFLKKKLPPPQ